MLKINLDCCITNPEKNIQNVSGIQDCRPTWSFKKTRSAFYNLRLIIEKTTCCFTRLNHLLPAIIYHSKESLAFIFFSVAPSSNSCQIFTQEAGGKEKKLVLKINSVGAESVYLVAARPPDTLLCLQWEKGLLWTTVATNIDNYCNSQMVNTARTICILIINKHCFSLILIRASSLSFLENKCTWNPLKILLILPTWNRGIGPLYFHFSLHLQIALIY